MKNKLFRCLTALTLTTALICVGGCSNSADTDAKGGSGDSSKGTIAVLLQRTTEKRYNAADVPAMKAAAEKLGYELTVQSAEGDGEAQTQQSEVAINQGVKCIILQAVDTRAGAGIVKAAHEEGIPVIAYNDIIADCELEGFVGRDSKQLGIDEAERMVSLYPKGNYAIVGGDSSAAVANAMIEGYHEVLSKHPEIKVVSEQFNADWSAESAQKQIEGALLANNDEIAAILSNNDNMAIGCIQALASAGLDGKVGICGQDCEIAALKAINNGKMSFTAFTDFNQMGTDALTLADAIINGTLDKLENTSIYKNGTGGDVLWLPTTVNYIDKDNLEEFCDTNSWWADKAKVFE